VHLAMVMGDVRTEDPVMVRVHTENVTCDMFGSTIDDTGYQLRRALEKIAEAGQGVVLYLRQSEHGLDLIHQLRTYALMQERGVSKREASAEHRLRIESRLCIGAQIPSRTRFASDLLLDESSAKNHGDRRALNWKWWATCHCGTPASEERSEIGEQLV
jgi:3,4-dihydroxy 2-butanone 4-phosphate synthase/GTP cyclohydrolase II